MGLRPLPPIPPIPPIPPVRPPSSFDISIWGGQSGSINWSETKVKPVSHTIYICTVNKKKTIERIYAAIVGLGVNVSAADTANHSLCANGEDKKTTIAAIEVHNFNPNFKRGEILDRIAKAIDSFDYFGVILMCPDGSSVWRAGNVYHDNFDRVLSTVTPEKSTDRNSEIEKEPKQELKQAPEPEPKEVSKPRIDLQLLTKVIRATVDMSDIFFETTQSDRRLLARELEKLCENPDATIIDLVPQDSQPEITPPKL